MLFKIKFLSAFYTLSSKNKTDIMFVLMVVNTSGKNSLNVIFQSKKR